MKKITILSGKGGVGKSTIAASLAITLSKKYKVIAADCDVDASNLGLVLGVKELNEKRKISTNEWPEFDLGKCNSCKKCYNNCYFKAINWIKNKPELKPFGCEGCGVCAIVCPTQAIELRSVDNAKIGTALTKYGLKIVSAQLGIGQSGSGKVVTEVRKLAEKNNAEIMLIDAAAGIGCPVIASVTGVDFVIMVTEPTPSAFEDMKRALQLVRHFNIPNGIVINKYDVNIKKTMEIEKFSQNNNVPILAKLPYDKKFVDALVNMKPIIIYDKKYSSLFRQIADKVISKVYNRKSIF